ncbi:MAG: hypothetical protein EZS28_047797, partial [Streblomastix strix]
MIQEVMIDDGEQLILDNQTLNNISSRNSSDSKLRKDQYLNNKHYNINAKNKSQPATFAALRITFDLVSAYGNVGISLGCASYSGSGERPFFKDLSRIIFAMMMFFGKHREIPSSLDNAIDFRHFLTLPVAPEHIIYSEDKWKMVVSTKKGRKRMKRILSRSVIEYDNGIRQNIPSGSQ